MRFWILILMYLCFTLISVGAKTILINEESGLSNITVKSIVKDKAGKMYVGTKRGLNYYDGYQFTLVEDLKRAEINILAYDSNRNVVWIGTETGLYYLNCETRQLSCMYNHNNPVKNILIYQKNVYIGFKSKYILKISEIFSCKVIFYSGSKNLSEKMMTIDEQENIYFRFNGERFVTKLSKEGKQLAKKAFQRGDFIQAIQYVDHELIVAYSSAGLEKMDSLSAPKWYISKLNQMGYDPEYLLDAGSKLLIGFRNATKLFEINKRTQTTRDCSIENPAIFSNKRIFCIYLDLEKNIWMGTSKGIIKITHERIIPAFEKLLCDSIKPISTRQIIEDETGNVYVGSYSGLFEFDKVKNRWFKHGVINFMKKNETFIVRSIFNISNRYLYTGSDANYFCLFDKKTKKISPVMVNQKDNNGVFRQAIYGMDMDKKGLLWMATSNGLATFDTATKEVTFHTKGRFHVNQKEVRAIYMLHGKKQFWIGGANGIALLDIERGILFTLNDNSSPALSDNIVNAITSDWKGNIWIATSSGGINILSADHKNITTITNKNGLSSNEVYSMLWQDSIRLWMATNNGLNYYNTQTHSVLPFHAKDGLNSDEFNQNSAYRFSDGKLYFGGVNGITSFYPKTFDYLTTPFRIFLSGLHKWDAKKEGSTDMISTTNDNEVLMNPGDNQLTFSFGSTDYSEPENVAFLYKIDELSDTWIPTENMNSLKLNNIKPGYYTLQIKALNRSRGEESVNMLSYQLHIKQVFYQTIWFYILVAIGFIGLVMLYYTLRLRNIRKMDLLRINIASNLHDEVGSLLTRITMSADRLVYRSDDMEAREKLGHMSELSRKANVAMSDVLWAIDTRNDIIVSLTDRMREHAEDMLLPNVIDVEIDFKGVDQQQKLLPEFRQHLFLIFKEAINNIIKHSEATLVQISYKQNRDSFSLYIKNNGVTSFKEEGITGLGLKNIRMRAEYLKAKADIIVTNDTFEVRIISKK